MTGRILLCFIFLSCGCIRHPTKSSNNEQPNAMKIGLVLDKGGKDDKSFNSAAYLGSTQAAQTNKLNLKTVECPDDTAFEPAMRTFAERGYPLVIVIGFSQIDALKKVAPLYPQTNFVIIDGQVDAPNVASVSFAEHEGSYLVGYLAGLATRTGKIGFIGGMDVPLIRRFQMGYEAGAKAARPNVQISANYSGVTSQAWANPSRGKELALGQYARGVDIIFVAAGATNMGVFDAAEEKKELAIGVDSNQNGIKPGRILTSMLKRVDLAVEQVIQQKVAGHLLSGQKIFGLSDKGVDYAVDANNAELIKPFQTQLEKVRMQIINGQIKVPDYYKVGAKDSTKDSKGL